MLYGLYRGDSLVLRTQTVWFLKLLKIAKTIKYKFV